MRITEVIVAVRDVGKLRAFVSITIDECFVVRGLKVIEGRNGLFVSMPSRPRSDGTFQDIAHPINNQTREQIESVILAKYHEVARERGDDFEGAGVPAPRLPTIGPLSAALRRAIPRGDDTLPDFQGA